MSKEIFNDICEATYSYLKEHETEFYCSIYDAKRKIAINKAHPKVDAELLYTLKKK